MRDQLTAVFLALVAMGLSLTSSLAGSTSERLTTRDGIPWLRYLPAEGVQDGPIPGVVAEAPQGLEALYGWMTEPRDDTDARLFRMPNGRLLVSCSRTEVGVDISPEEMIRIWPEIAAKLAKNAQYVDDG
ncbi:MAG: hypothetical protein FWF86_09470, partial [Clostridia bacterium]|nr:hypothetical protein [Clostridia bacterium]